MHRIVLNVMDATVHKKLNFSIYVVVLSALFQP